MPKWPWFKPVGAMDGPSFPSFQALAVSLGLLSCQEAIEEQLRSRRALLQSLGDLQEAVCGAASAAAQARARASLAPSSQGLVEELQGRVEHTVWGCRRLVEMAWLAESREGEGLQLREDELLESLREEVRPKAAERPVP